MDEYQKFIKSKLRTDIASGFDCDVPVGPLFDFQAACVKWALKRGRAALFLDTGLGKTLSQATWANMVCEHTGGDVIIVAPLCVAQQTVEEAAKFGITVKYCRDDDEVEPGITITNYEMLDHFDLTNFAGVVLDESSILKSHTSKTREQLVQSFRDTPYKLSCTATPSPNDYIELGNQADFLGVMSAQEMLATFFTHDGGDTSKWRLKGHGKVKFWEWMATWSICIRNPADLGFDGSRYELPPLRMVEHTVTGGQLMEGQLFHVVAQSLSERREAKRNSMADRVALVKEIVSSRISDKLAASPINEVSHVEAGICSEAQREIPPGQRGTGEEAGSIRTGSDSAQGLHAGIREGESGEIPQDARTAGEGQRDAPQAVRGKRGSARTSQGEGEAVAGCKPAQAPCAEAECVRADAGNLRGDDGFAESPMCNLRSLGQEPEKDIPNDRPLPFNGEGSRDTMLKLQHGIREVQGQPGTAGGGDSVSEPWLIWCHLNDEQDALEKLFGDQCFSVQGTDSPHQKEKAIMGWLHGERPIMISKPSIMGYGLNFQHCANMIFAGMDDSFEKYYQAVRRCYRFGQKKPVTVHIITAETEGAVKANIERKQAQANQMAGEMVAYMQKMTRAQIEGARSNTESYTPTVRMTIPQWINNNIGA